MFFVICVRYKGMGQWTLRKDTVVAYFKHLFEEAK